MAAWHLDPIFSCCLISQENRKLSNSAIFIESSTVNWTIMYVAESHVGSNPCLQWYSKYHSMILWDIKFLFCCCTLYMTFYKPSLFMFHKNWRLISFLRILLPKYFVYLVNERFGPNHHPVKLRKIFRAEPPPQDLTLLLLPSGPGATLTGDSQNLRIITGNVCN